MSQSKPKARSKNSFNLTKKSMSKEDNEEGFTKFHYTESSFYQFVKKNSQSVSYISNCNVQTQHRLNSEEVQESRSLENIAINIRQLEAQYAVSASNNLRNLGINKSNLTTQYLHLQFDSPITKWMLMLSQSDTMMRDESIKSLCDQTSLIMSQNTQFKKNGINSYGVFVILQELLRRQGITTIMDSHSLQERKEQLVHNERESSFYLIFSPLDLHILCSNISALCILLRVAITDQVR